MALTVVVVTLALFGLHGATQSASQRAEGPGSLAEKTASARLAARLEPWNRKYARRASVLELWYAGQRLLEAGEYNAAVDVLRKAYASNVGNPELLALFKKAQFTQALETNKKAHLQHGHEGPGGTLRPEDLER